MNKVLTGALTFTSLKPCDLSNCTKREILAYFENSYDLNESLFAALNDDSVFYKCPDRLRLPLIFYYGHTACVYMNKLVLSGLLKPDMRPNLTFETLFETGVDEMSWDDTENYRMGGKYQWPELDDVIEYRRTVRQIVRDLIEDTPLELPITMDSPWWAVFMGMEHERIHLETSSVLIRQLPVDLVTCPPGWKYAPLTTGVAVETPKMIEMKSTDVVLGKPVDFPSYGWDNEYGEFKCKVPAFEASNYLVTNREFLEFVLDGGYQKSDVWGAEGWRWRQYRCANHPSFWVCDKGCKSGCGADLASVSHCKLPSHLSNGQNGYCNGHDVCDENGHQGADEGGGHNYKLRLMFDLVDMPWDWPVEVNYLEAKAYCRWKGDGLRLMCEAEHNVIRGPQAPVSDGVSSDIIHQDVIDANVNMQYGSSTPVNMYPANEAGFYDVYGNVWEWQEDHFNGLPGFNTTHLYDDFSTPCFDGRHNCILGGSWVSTGDEASRFGRYAFRRHFFQHCGFRVARWLDDNKDDTCKLPVRFINTDIYVIGEDQVCQDAEEVDGYKVPSTNSQYLCETQTTLQDMLCEEYGQTGEPWVVGLARQCGQWIEQYDVSRRRALHMGCATGRATVQLAPYFQDVLAQDFCARFIHACQNMKNGKPVVMTTENGGKKNVAFPPNTHLDNVTFKLMTWLPNEVGFFTFILSTFLDRVQNVKSWTARMPEILEAGGVTVIASCGKYTKNTLEPLLAGKFDFLEEKKFANNKGADVDVTVWRRA